MSNGFRQLINRNTKEDVNKIIADLRNIDINGPLLVEYEIAGYLIKLVLGRADLALDNDTRPRLSNINNRNEIIKRLRDAGLFKEEILSRINNCLDAFCLLPGRVYGFNTNKEIISVRESDEIQNYLKLLSQKFEVSSVSSHGDINQRT